MDRVHLHYVSHPTPPARAETKPPPYVMGEEETNRWRRYVADRRVGASIVSSLRDATDYSWEPGE
jgi:hypothetical protein